jgi:DNA repair photolyase
VAQKSGLAWGEFVDVKTNLLEVLATEAEVKKPRRILIGSVTDPYQPLELEHRLTRRVLDMAHEQQWQVTILTRSAHILEDMERLQALPGVRVYFTVSWPDENHLRVFEPRSPLLNERVETIRQLRAVGIEVIPNVSPLFPGLFDLEPYFVSLATLVETISFESFNLKVIPPEEMTEIMARQFPAQAELFSGVYAERTAYDQYWGQVRQEIEALAKKYRVKTELRLHEYDSYFGRD